MSSISFNYVLPQQIEDMLLDFANEEPQFNLIFTSKTRHATLLMKS